MTSRRLMLEMVASGIKRSGTNVHRRLIEADLRAYRPRKKPQLTDAMKRKILAWAKQSEHG